jgi:hypothetical protein
MHTKFWAENLKGETTRRRWEGNNIIMDVKEIPWEDVD